MEIPLTAGPCQGTILCIKLGAKAANRLNIEKAVKADREAKRKGIRAAAVGICMLGRQSGLAGRLSPFTVLALGAAGLCSAAGSKNIA